MNDFFENKCEIVRDLLPLYADHLASEKTNELISTHLIKCIECRKHYERIKNSREKQREENILSLSPDQRAFFKRLRRFRIVEQAICSCAALLSISAVIVGIKSLEQHNEQT